MFKTNRTHLKSNEGGRQPAPFTNSSAGFSLVEMAIVVLISGLIIAASAAAMKPYIDYSRRNATQAKLDNIALALSDFAQQYGRLPCPADPVETLPKLPFGTPRTGDATSTDPLVTMGLNARGGLTYADCNPVAGGAPTIASQIGIIPFRTLGLTEDQARDGYGNLITYTVSLYLTHLPADYILKPSASQLNQRQLHDAVTNLDIHSMCRLTTPMQPIWNNASANVNAAKAAICCPPARVLAYNDISVLDGLGGVSLYSGAHSVYNATTIPVNYGGMDASLTSRPNDIDTHLIAFVLISHGLDGDGAYIKNSNLNNPVTIASATAQESQNEPLNMANLAFVSRPISMTNDTNYFDDIVVWRTNDQLISAGGNDSCARP